MATANTFGWPRCKNCAGEADEAAEEPGRQLLGSGSGRASCPATLSPRQSAYRLRLPFGQNLASRQRRCFHHRLGRMARQPFPQRSVHTRLPAYSPGPERAQYVGIETCGRDDMTRGTLVLDGFGGREARGQACTTAVSPAPGSARNRQLARPDPSSQRV